MAGAWDVESSRNRQRSLRVVTTMSVLSLMHVCWSMVVMREYVKGNIERIDEHAGSLLVLCYQDVRLC